MINLRELKAEAESKDGDRTVVERSWLKQVLTELTACREAQAHRGQCFGLQPGERL